MKLVFTKNELVTMVKTTMTIPGLMKKFLTDDYIIKTFEEKIVEINKKTTAVVYSKVNDEYTIEVTEMFTLELISEFGSLINAMITLTIGVGARMKMIADKYKVKEDDLSEKPKSDVLGDPFMGSNYTVYGTRKNIANILPNIENINYIKNVLVINNKKYHNQYYRNRIQHRLDVGGYIDGLVLVNDAVYALYANRDESNTISIYNVEASDLGIIIDTEYLLGEVNKDDIILLKSLSIVEPKDIYYLFFNSIDDIKNFLLVNKLCYNRSKQDNIEDAIKPDITPTETIYEGVVCPSRLFDLITYSAAYVIQTKGNNINHDVYDTYKNTIFKDGYSMDGLIYHNGVLAAIVNNDRDSKFPKSLFPLDKEIGLKSDIKQYGSLSMHNNTFRDTLVGINSRYYIFFKDLIQLNRFLKDNSFNIQDTKPKENKIKSFHDLDISLASHTFLAKDTIISVDDYNKYKTGLIRGSTQIDGLIFHNGKIYEIRPLSGSTDMDIILITKDEYISSGTISRVVDTYDINIPSIDTAIDTWILFFNNLDNMHLFLDKNFKL